MLSAEEEDFACCETTPPVKADGATKAAAQDAEVNATTEVMEVFMVVSLQSLSLEKCSRVCRESSLGCLTYLLGRAIFFFLLPAFSFCSLASNFPGSLLSHPPVYLWTTPEVGGKVSCARAPPRPKLGRRQPKATQERHRAELTTTTYLSALVSDKGNCYKVPKSLTDKAEVYCQLFGVNI